MRFSNRPPVGPGQESVWDYPRPPRWEPVARRLRVVFNGVTIAETTRGKRVLETSHPPVYYFPPEDVRMDHLQAARGSSFCEWKGTARYFDVAVGGKRADRTAWAYLEPTPTFAAIKHHLAFYPNRMEACFVGDDRARATRRFLWRLDYRRTCRSVQRRTGNCGLVTRLRLFIEAGVSTRLGPLLAVMRAEVLVSLRLPWTVLLSGAMPGPPGTGPRPSARSRPQLVDADRDFVTAAVVGNIVVAVVQAEFQGPALLGDKLDVGPALFDLRSDPQH